MPRQYNKGDPITFLSEREEEGTLAGTVHVALHQQGRYPMSIYWVSIPDKKDDYTVFEHEIIEFEVKEKPRFRLTPEQKWVPLNEAARVLLAQEQGGKEA